MSFPSSADEGEPGTNRNNPLFSIHLIFTLIVLSALTACQSNNKNEKKPPADSQQRRADSLLQQQRAQRQADSLATMQKKKAARKKIYLTFDDGPNKGTSNVLSVIKEQQVAVSFFIVGKHVFDSPQQHANWELLKADSAIELCNHSYTHALNRYTKFYQDPAGVVQDFQQSQEKLQFNNKVARMPGRNAWRIDSIRVTDIKESRAAIDSLHNAGFAIMGWDIEWSFNHKTMTPDPDTALLLRRIKNLLDAGTTQTPGHLVLLAHDQAFQKQPDIETLHGFIRELKNNEEYEFVLASKYPGVK
ncbi:MAG: polysaccharide deacetylase family protein [Chitinophagaceae bacterium]|nr:polysaccharide deacetylase family protein [Chitinophagaceae bacterium]